MLNVTDQAKDTLQDLRQDAMQRAGVKDEQAVERLVEKFSSGGQRQLDFRLDRPQEGDQVVEHHGQQVLVLDPVIAAQLDGATLDTAETAQGRRLTIRAAGPPAP
jgi:Fe-S cluster assembly iron-binding protein IscA